MKLNLFGAVFTAVAMLFTSCDDESQLLDTLKYGDSKLSISVLTEQIESKGLITDTYLPNASAVGVTVLNTSGVNYDGTAYSNIKFTSSGTGTSQTWAGATEVKLSATEGYCYAYYPYNPSVTNVTSIPVYSGETDYMYADRRNVNDKDKNVSLTMRHALASIRLAIKRGTYTGTGAISSLSIKSTGFGTSGYLNATSGYISTVSGTNTNVTLNKSLTINENAQNVDFIVVPANVSGPITVTITVDGKEYATTLDEILLKKGNCYTYNLTCNAGALSISNVSVGIWGYNDVGNPTIRFKGYNITLDGDINEISFRIYTLANVFLYIEASHKNGYYINAATITGTCNSSQSDYHTYRHFLIASIKSDITVTFNGCTSPPAAIANYWSDLADGVYAVRPDLKPADISKGNMACIGVGLVNNATGQRLMIEKYEHTNASYKQSFTDYGATSTSYYYFNWGCYGQTMNSLLGISDYPSLVKANISCVDGFLPDKNGNYCYNYNNLGLPDSWPSDDSQYALADRAGKRHSEYLMKVTQSDDYTVYPKAGQLLKSFLKTSDALGYSDWYVPACGQLALFYVYMSDINAGLTAIGGTTLTPAYYWSSSEYSSGSGWSVHLSIGEVDFLSKSNGYRLRLVRDL